MKFAKKADGGLSMSFIVILAISLIVMLIIIGIFASRSSEGNQNLRSCEGRGGICIAADTQCPGDSDHASSTPLFGGICFTNGERDNRVCCLRKFDDDD